METLRPFLDQAVTIWKDSTAAARVGIVLLALLCVVAIAGVGIWSATPEYVDLPPIPQEQLIPFINELESAGVNHKMKGNLVSINKMDKSTVSLIATKLGLNNGDSEFVPDDPGIWVDPRTHAENRRYNKEKQIESLIRKLGFVTKADVILDLPHQQPFARKSGKRSASVMVVAKPGVYIDDQKATAIAKMVANAAGIPVESIEITDHEGYLFQTGDAHRNLMRQDQIRIANEQLLSARAEKMLERIVGVGNATVQVNVELDYKDEESKIVDFESDQAWIREEVVETVNEKNGKPNPIGAAGTASNNSSSTLSSSGTMKDKKEEKFTTKKEAPMTETVSRTRQATIKALTVAVLVNSTGIADDTGTVAPEIAQQYTDLVKNAIGFNLSRGDQIAINFSKFSDVFVLDEAPAQPIPWDQIHQILKNISLGLAGLVALLLGIMAIKKITPPSRPVNQAVNRGSQVEQLRDLIKDNPEVFSQIIAAWSNTSPENNETGDAESVTRRAA